MNNIYLYPHLHSGDKPIETVTEYEEALAEYKKFESTKSSLSKEEQMDFWKKEIELRGKLIHRRSPVVLVAICPFCDKKVYANLKSGVFSLDENFWLLDYDDAKNAYYETICTHLFAIDGALHLQNNPPPVELKGFKSMRFKITMASEVPFSKPRILNKEGVIAVIHSISIAEKYIGYSVSYFSPNKISQNEFCIGWARQEYVDHLDGISNATFSGKRSDKHDYELLPWVKKEKLFWLEGNVDTIHLAKHEKNFPYSNIQGRKHPYAIENGKITNYPDPKETPPKTEIETFMPSIG